MKNDEWMGILVILGIIGIGLSSGSKGAGINGLVSNGQMTPAQKQQNIAVEIQSLETQVNDLKKKVAEQEENKNTSIYKGKVSLSYVNRSTDPNQEYIVLRVNNATTTIPITGWTIKSLSSGTTITIPKATYLFFANTTNVEQDIYLTGNDTVYLVTGYSPNGASFKINKCSGYLNQFQTFIPYIGGSCPAPRDEDLSSIPNRVINDACLDYIQYFPSCRIQTTPLPQNWSTECYEFIYEKINYPSCVDTHKNDKDFYLNEWRVYLKRNDKIWKNSREEIVLYDKVGKVVSTLKY